MVNYQNGKIYKIVCNITGLIYIGSTAEKYLSNRLAKHRTNYKDYLNGKFHYITSFKILENNNYEIILLETYPCNNKYELEARERFYIEICNCANKCIPNRTKKEWYEDNKNYIIEKTKQYQKDNKDYYKQYQKQYREDNKDKIKQYKKEYNKQYQENNKDKIAEYNKQYYLKKKLEKKLK
jgi:hypothetical protein